MLVTILQVEKEYRRISGQGLTHTYKRKHEVAVLRCNSCNELFERRVRDMDRRRLTSEHSHVCSCCDQKKYAQSKGVENRRFWNTTVDLDRGIDSI